MDESIYVAYLPTLLEHVKSNTLTIELHLQV